MGLFKKLKEIKNQANALNNRGIELGAVDSIALVHESGLPLSERELCKVFLCSDRIVICASRSEFNINLSQINNTKVISTNEIKDSSGRVIYGGKPENGAKTCLVFHFIVNYTNSNNEISNIVLNSGYDSSTPNKFSEKINRLLINKSTIINL